MSFIQYIIDIYNVFFSSKQVFCRNFQLQQRKLLR